jgi:hypothetical protein
LRRRRGRPLGTRPGFFLLEGLSLDSGRAFGAPDWKFYGEGGEDWFGFKGVRALGDREPDVLMIPLHGHTPGHCGIAVRGKDGWLLHAGDSYFFHGQLQAKVRMPLVLGYFQRKADIDREARVANQERLRALQAAHGSDVTIFNSTMRSTMRIAVAAGIRIGRCCRDDYRFAAGGGGASACFAGGSVCTLQLDAASEACACGIRPGSGAKAFSTIRPVELGESMINRSAAVISSSSGNSACWASVIRSSSITLRPAERSLMA